MVHLPNSGTGALKMNKVNVFIVNATKVYHLSTDIRHLLFTFAKNKTHVITTINK